MYLSLSSTLRFRIKKSKSTIGEEPVEGAEAPAQEAEPTEEDKSAAEPSPVVDEERERIKTMEKWSGVDMKDAEKPADEAPTRARRASPSPPPSRPVRAERSPSPPRRSRAEYSSYDAVSVEVVHVQNRKLRRIGHPNEFETDRKMRTFIKSGIEWQFLIFLPFNFPLSY